MKYGVCLGMKDLEKIAFAADCGYDYIESNFGNLGRGEESDFQAFKKLLIEKGINCESANCFMPGDLKVTGEEGCKKIEEMKEYIDKGMKRGSEVGLKVVVFGSSGARNISEDFDYTEACRQMLYFIREIASPIAEKYGITLVTEPLRYPESNMVNSVREGVMLAALVNKPNVSGLADIYHMEGAGDTNTDIRRLHGCILHAHISNPNGDENERRVYPLDENEFDYKGFVDALKFAGCQRCSIEASQRDFFKEAPISLKLLKSL